MTGPDPWSVLGLRPGASVAEARAARRRLAKQFHPDLHAGRPATETATLAARMTQVNRALAQIEAEAAVADSGPAAHSAPDRPAAGGGPAAGGEPGRGGDSGAADEAAEEDPTAPPEAGAADRTGAGHAGLDAFSVDWLPAEAFEMLFVAAYGLGDILVIDEPYLMELYLLEPAPCFCRMTLVPEAGGTLVTVDISPAADGANAPLPEAVIAVLNAELDALVSG